MVSANSWARMVDLFVAMLPLKPLGFKVNLNKEGQQPYHPSTMLKLYLYGYRKGIRSSRKLAEQCKINIEVMWLIGELSPPARKIAYFRKDNAQAFKAAFRYFVVMLKDLTLIEGKTIALDSFKIRAQNSLKNNYNQKKIERHKKYIEEKLTEYEQELNKNDGNITPKSREEIQSKINNKKEQKKKYERLEKEIEETGEKQISTTDPDSKAVIFQRTAVKVGYNIQATTDQKHKLFVNNDTGSVNDTHALSSMSIDAKELLQVEKMDVIADKGVHYRKAPIRM